MVQVLQNKNLATKFQILIEIAAKQPNVQQKDIAKKLNITSQAVSEYIKDMVKEGTIISDGRSRYRVTREGVNWVLRAFRELRDYCAYVEKTITLITVCTAVSDCDLPKGQKVGLEMKDGILFATESTEKGAWGITTSAARKGENVGISNIEGMVELEIGTITIVQVPNIKDGGSHSTDLSLLEKQIHTHKPIGAIGIEALTALRLIGIEPQYFYGVSDAAVEAAYSGLSFLIVCTDDEIPYLLLKLREAQVKYKIIHAAKGEGLPSA